MSLPTAESADAGAHPNIANDADDDTTSEISRSSHVLTLRQLVATASTSCSPPTTGMVLPHRNFIDKAVVARRLRFRCTTQFSRPTSGLYR